MQDLRSKLSMYMNIQAKKEEQPSKQKVTCTDNLEGEVCFFNEMQYFKIEKRYPLTHYHGGIKLREVLNMDMSFFQEHFCKSEQNISINDFLFLDTETTGLSGGTGTIAFLIGVGFFDEDSFVLRQYFMRDYDEESAVLNSLCQLMSERRVLVTFNGKSFDWSLLKTRFICNRIKPTFGEPIHIDLLYPSRSIWKLKLQSCRLSSLEENVLEEYRIDDIPGYMIPEIYFKYLEDRDLTDLRKVIIHNELDILSLVSLMLKINSMLKDPLGEAYDELELFGVGRIFEKNGDFENIVKCYDACADSNNNMIKGYAARRLANIYRKNGDHLRAANILERLREDSESPSIQVSIELAKYYEHREKNLHKAIVIVNEAIDTCVKLGLKNSFYYIDLKKRNLRLKKKIINLKSLSGE